MFLTNVLFKLPSFVLDFIGLKKVLIGFRPDKRRYIAVFYYASPIVIYSVYMHGQLDLIPMVFLVIALSFLMSKKGKKTSIFICSNIYGSSTFLCKFHILAVLPIIFFYIQKRDSLKCALGYTAGVIIGVIAGVLPVWSEGFKFIVLFNAEQSVLTKVAFDFGTVQMYIPIIAVLFIYLLAFKINYMNRELFLNFLWNCFCSFLSFLSTYARVVCLDYSVFCSFFFAFINQEKYKNIAVYVGLNGIYLLYFIFLHNRGMVDLYIGKKKFCMP